MEADTHSLWVKKTSLQMLSLWKPTGWVCTISSIENEVWIVSSFWVIAVVSKKVKTQVRASQEATCQRVSCSQRSRSSVASWARSFKSFSLRTKATVGAWEREVTAKTLSKKALGTFRINRDLRTFRTQIYQAFRSRTLAITGDRSFEWHIIAFWPRRTRPGDYFDYCN